MDQVWHPSDFNSDKPLNPPTLSGGSIERETNRRKPNGRQVSECTRGDYCNCKHELEALFESIFIDCRHIDNGMKKIWKRKDAWGNYESETIRHTFDGFLLGYYEAEKRKA